MSLISFLHTVKWFQVLRYNSHNLTFFIFCTVCSIWPIDRVLSGATTPSQREHGRNDNEGLLYIPLISKADVLTSNDLISYPGHSCLVSWGCRIHWLYLWWGLRPLLTIVLDMTLNNLIVRFQWCWSFGECGIPLYWHCSHVHSGPEW